VTVEPLPFCPDPIILSWSGLLRWEKCRQQELLVLKHKTSPLTNGRNFIQGTLADRCMRWWLEDPERKPGGMIDYLEQAWNENTGENAERRIEWKGVPAHDQARVKEFVKNALVDLEPILYEKVLPYSFAPELKFKTDIAIPWIDGSRNINITLRGGIDLAIKKSDSHFAIYDLKTTADDSYVRGKTLAQLTFYDLACWAMFGVQPKEWGFITPAATEKFIPVEVTDEERRVMLTRITEYCHGVWQRQWQVTDNDSDCFNCPVKRACPKWDRQVVQDTAGKQRVSFLTHNP
jgi:CRISPR/Cas system-associated exonuclease Cas4 (RecB family)